MTKEKPNEILTKLKEPQKLEQLYHDNPDQFLEWLIEAIKRQPNSDTLNVWHARLNFSKAKESTNKSKKGLLYVFLASILVFILLKIPNMLLSMPSIPNHISYSIERLFYTRFIPIIVISSVIGYFLRLSKSKSIKFFCSIGVLISLIYMGFLPDNYSSSTIEMATLHMPFVLVVFLGVAFVSENWRNPNVRLNFIRYLGELIINSSLILLGGVVLTMLTLGLFDLIGLNITEFYMRYIVVAGLASTPLVATYLYDDLMERKSKLASIIARVFSPLVLVTVFIYLIVIIFQGKSPFVDRDFLITLNGLLLIVLAIVFYSISGPQTRQPSKIGEWVNILLIILTLIINGIALFTIVYRLFEFGISPNRIAVIGGNLLCFVHLILILASYLNSLKSPHYTSEKLNKTVANYLTLYSIWALFIVFILPILFWFK